MNRTLENPFYYLENFLRVTQWISERYDDLLTDDERAFLAGFTALPQASQALLVRMVMRKGEVFRASKLRYEEIGSTQEAALPLLAHGWIDDQALLSLDQLFAVLTKAEIAEAFRAYLPNTTARKTEQLEALRPHFSEARPFADWHPASDDCVYHVLINPICDRLKLMFFGNCHQDWTEFVLSDLGIYRYEKVEFSASSRGFKRREDVDLYLHLHRCRERFEQGALSSDILEDVRASIIDNDWLEGRRAKLLFQIAQHQERSGALSDALALYTTCACPGARMRAVRVMERLQHFEGAFALAKCAAHMPESEAEKQQLARVLPRLHRKLGLPPIMPRPAPSVRRIDLALPPPDTTYSVERLAAEQLAHNDSPVYYVENTLINSLFGLLCWEAVFAAVPGAFFHPFHTGPADLHSADFHVRRKREFADCLSQLDSDRYISTINRHFAEKNGIQSPFVTWSVLSEELKEFALACIPAAHLKQWFAHILQDIKSNRTGFPDLIQFWPREQSYRMIEVKGPGDRLQDSQLRWLDYCAERGMPVSVCYVQWMEGSV
jgi:hypothetical protein